MSPTSRENCAPGLFRSTLLSDQSSGKGTPIDTLSDTPSDTPSDTTCDTPNDTPGNTPSDTPSDTWERAPRRVGEGHSGGNELSVEGIQEGFMLSLFLRTLEYIFASLWGAVTARRFLGQPRLKVLRLEIPRPHPHPFHSHYDHVDKRARTGLGEKA